MTLITSLILSVTMLVSSAVYKLQPPEPPTTEELAAECGLTTEEFELMSAVVEAESNRSIPENEDELIGRIMIAATIINRVNSDYFPNDVVSVLTQRSQFSTVRNGHSVTNSTEYSDEAVVLAYEYLEAGEIPTNVLFFNCVGFNNGSPYRRGDSDTIGGNYFMTYGEEVPYNAN